MKPLCALALFLLLALPLCGQEGQPNTLTPKEAAEGWLLLFDGESTFGWQIEGAAKVEKGELVLGGEKETKARFRTQFNEFDLHFESNTEGTPAFTLAGATWNYRSPFCRERANQWGTTSWRVDYDRKLGARIIPRKDPHGVGVSQQQAAEEPLTLLCTAPAGSTLRLRNFKLKPRGVQNLFTGKDLSGWKLHPNKKATFSVTPEGWVNVKNGPGDLQTEGHWADFVFQGECLSKGKHLNSGIFFRCLPNQYQLGYEAQIHNHFTAEPKQIYEIEEYAPKTNALLSKKKSAWHATDYGTGAIYRRIPARKSVAQDGEWFTLTIVAQGRHVATWVDGMQVVDWDDYRPLAANARQGAYLQAGALSIQGHDPTTDLSFRHFRLAALPTATKTP